MQRWLSAGMALQFFGQFKAFVMLVEDISYYYNEDAATWLLLGWNGTMPVVALYGRWYAAATRKQGFAR